MAIPFVLNITGGEDALDTGLGGSGYSEDVAVFIGGELVPDKGGGGFVACIIRIFLLVRGMSGLTNSVEETVDLELALLTGLGVFELEALKEVAVALALGRDGLYISTYHQAKPRRETHVPEDSDLGVRGQPLGHDFGRAELVTADKNVDVGTVFGQVCVSATHIGIDRVTHR